MQKTTETDRKFLNFNRIWICVTQLEDDNFFPLDKTQNPQKWKFFSFSVEQDKNP